MRLLVSLLALVGVAAAATAQPRLVPQLGHTGQVWDAAFSPDGRYIATGGTDGSAHVWDAETGADLARLGGHDGRVHTVAFLPDGHLLTAGFDGARVWDVAARRAVRTLDRASDITLLDPEAAQLLMVGEEAVLVDLATGTAVRTFERVGDDPAAIGAFAFSADGRHVAAVVGADGRRDSARVRVWDVETGALRLDRAYADEVRQRFHTARFLPDGRLVAFYSLGGARAWDAATGTEAALPPYFEASYDVRYATDGTRVALQVGRPTGDGYDGLTAEVWDAETGQPAFAPSWAAIEASHGGFSVTGVHLSADGARLVTTGEDGRVVLWDVDRGRAVSVLGPRIRQGYSASFTASGQALASEHLWRLDTGDAEPLPPEAGAEVAADRVLVTTDAGRITVLDARGVPLLAIEADDVGASVLSADGQTLAVGHRDGAIEVWDVDAGARRASFGAPSAPPYGLTLRPDGAVLVVRGTGAEVGGQRTASYHALSTDDGTVLSTINEGTPAGQVPSQATFSPDGERLAFYSPFSDLPTTLWSIEAGTALYLPGTPPPFTGPAGPFSADGSRLLLASRDTVRVIEAATGAVETSVTLPPVGDDENPWAPSVIAAAFSPDGRRFLTVDGDGVGIVEYASTARVWDAATGEPLLAIQGYQDAGVETASWSPDGRHVATVGVDGTVQFWDAETGAEVAALFQFADGTWAVVDAEGRYDASNGGEVDGLVWVVDAPSGPEPLRLAQLKARYYDPGLLAKHLGFSDEPLRDIAVFRGRGVPLYPRASVPEAGPAGVSVAVENRGGGIGRVQVLLNGTEIVADARPPGFDAGAPRLGVEVDLTPFRRFLVPDSLNTVEVVAENAEGSLRSRRAQAAFVAPATRGGDVEDEAIGDDGYQPSLWAVVVGVGDYAGSALDLRFAGKDAADVAEALRVAATRLFGPDRTHVTLLTTEADGDGAPSRDAITDALAQVAAQADARDVLFVYLAGHGVVHGGQDGDFYFLTPAATSGDLADAAVREAVALSSQALEDLLADVPTQKRVLILDTCASGRVVEQLSAPRDVPGAQVRSLDRLKDNTGTFVLAGSAADAVSYEASQYGQGLLTWSLLEGMRLAADAEDNEVDVLAWFQHAERRVPALAQSIGGVQKPELVMPRGTGSYPVGRVRPEDQARIPLQDPRPVVLRASFQDELTFGDPVELTRAVNEALYEASASATRGGQAPLVYVDAEGYPEAYRLAGRYTADGEDVRVEARLIRAGAVQATVTASGAASDVAALAADVVAQASAAMQAASR